MDIKFEYSTTEERQQLIDNNREKILIGEEILTYGKFLTFTYNKPLTDQIMELKDDNLILMDALATSFEKIITLESKIDAMGGTV